LVEKCSKLVSHFKHSNIAKRSLEIKQEQLGMAKTALIQYCKTRWNSTFMMLKRLYLNRYSSIHTSDTTRQKNYICSLVSELPVKRRRPRTNNKIAKNSGDSEYNLDDDLDLNVIIDHNEENQRAVSREYFLLSSNSEKKRVCQKFFCATLSITFPVVNNALKNCNDFGMYTGIDERKGQVALNKLQLEKRNKVKNHINLFPRVESHYCRRDSSKQYLSSDLNISSMYRLYCEQIKTESYMLSPEGQEIPVNINIYRKIFNEYEPKLGFNMPKKDQCNKCNIFKDASEEQQNLLRPEWEQHKEREKEAMDSKTEDKQKAIENKGVNFRSITIDLQAILNLPYAGDSQICYMRKLLNTVIYGMKSLEVKVHLKLEVVFYNIYILCLIVCHMYLHPRILVVDRIETRM